MQDLGIPIVGGDHQITVTLQIGGEAPDSFLQTKIRSDVIPDGGEAGPHAHLARISPSTFGRILNGLDTTPCCLIGEKCVQNHTIKCPSSKFESVVTERRDTQWNVFAKTRVQSENWILSQGSVVAQDDLTCEQALHHLREILHLCRSNFRHSVRCKQGSDSSTNAEAKPSARQTMHRGCIRGRHERMSRVVISGRRSDAEIGGHGSDCSGERHGFLYVKALRNETRSQTKFLTLSYLLQKILR